MNLNDSHVALERVRLAFGTRGVFESLTCSFPRGGISVIMGGSGSGKSTILRLIGGLIAPQAGAVRIDGEDISRLSERGLGVVRRKLGMLFQGGALLDSYSIFDNVALPLRELRTMNETAIAGEVREALAAVGLRDDVRPLLPGELSGGMLRRAALARAIIRKPVVLLCDEPFSGLDPASIKRIEALLVNLNRDHGMTVIVVSHHIPSTLRMADRMLLLLEGRAIEGAPAELLRGGDAAAREFLAEEEPVAT